jgi:hypothetical protein
LVEFASRFCPVVAETSARLFAQFGQALFQFVDTDTKVIDWIASRIHKRLRQQQLCDVFRTHILPLRHAP